MPETAEVAAAERSGPADAAHVADALLEGGGSQCGEAR